MPNLQIAATLSTDVTIRVRLRAALIQRTLAFLNAPKPTAEPALIEWRKRRELAGGVLADVDSIVESVAWLIGNDYAVLAAATSKVPAGNVYDVTDEVLEKALNVALVTQMVLASRAEDDAPDAPVA